MFKRKKRDDVGSGDAYPTRKSPLRAEEQDAPQPERPVNPEQEQGNRPRAHPSQAEGERGT